jgi:hypothetical protein
VRVVEELSAEVYCHLVGEKKAMTFLLLTEDRLIDLETGPSLSSQGLIFENAVAGALERAGYLVDVRVGVGRFSIDIAVRELH